MKHDSKRRLKTYVHVPRPDYEGGSGEYVVFGPDDRIPDWAAERLADNPAVWADEDDERATPASAPSSLIGHEFKPGSMVSSPAVTPGHYEGGNP